MRWPLIGAFVAVFIIGAVSGRLLWNDESPGTHDGASATIVAASEAKCIPHGIATNQCTRCNPDLIAHFKEIGDWCASHHLPESQCDLCGFGAAHGEPELCGPHGIAVDQCTRCNPDLIAHFKEIGDWCASHHLPESQCDLCGFGAAHGEPELCGPHGIAVDQCTRCNPDLIAHFKEIGDWCAEHHLPESQCDLCNGGAVRAASVESNDGHDLGETEIDEHAGHEHDPSKRSTTTPYPGIAVSYASAEPHCPSDGAVIQFASIETSARAGVTVQPVMTAPTARAFEAPAEVVFDQSATTYMSSTLPVAIRQWLIEPGDIVQAGTPLARVESPEMAALQGEYLEAWSDWMVHQRERTRSETLMSRGLIDSASHDRAIADAISSESRTIQTESQLRLAGMADVDLDVLREHRLVSSTFLLRAPVAGTLLDRSADLGSVLESGMPLVTIGDPDALWIEASVRERDLNRVRLGRHVVFTPDAGDSEPIAGAVTWISQFLDPHTRTGIVRMEPLREAHRIRAHEFGRLQLTDDVSQSSVVIPKSAVQWEGCCNVVFVQDTPDRFYPRKVEVERADNAHYRVLSGLTATDEIVTSGSFLLKTELKKGSIGAGCCGLDAES